MGGCYVLWSLNFNAGAHAVILQFFCAMKFRQQAITERWVDFKAGPLPLEALLVIFGRKDVIFYCLKALRKIWKMTPLLCACAVVITLETQKCRKRAPLSVEFNFFISCDRHKRFRRMKEEGQIYKTLPQIFKFLPRDLVMIFQSLVMIFLCFFFFFSTLKDHN